MAVPDRRGGSARQVPMFRTLDYKGTGYYAPYDDTVTPHNWQGDEEISGIVEGEDKPFVSRTVFGGGDTYRQPGTAEHSAQMRKFADPEIRSSEQFNLIGHERAETVPNRNMQWSDLTTQVEEDWDNYELEGAHDVIWRSPEGSQVAHAYMSSNDWGPRVETAEIMPEYQGRGWSREMMGDIAQNYGHEGVIHAEGFTPAGASAFEKKGVPDEISLEDKIDSRAVSEARAAQRGNPLANTRQYDAAMPKARAEMMADQGRLIDGLMQSLGRRRPGDSHGPRYSQDRIQL